jgi:hypothetical protein
MNQKQQAKGRESLEEVREQFKNWRSQRVPSVSVRGTG